MSEETKKAVEALVKEAGDDPVKMAFLAGMKAGDAMRKIAEGCGKDAEDSTKEE